MPSRSNARAPGLKIGRVGHVAHILFSPTSQIRYHPAASPRCCPSAGWYLSARQPHNPAGHSRAPPTCPRAPQAELDVVYESRSDQAIPLALLPHLGTDPTHFVRARRPAQSRPCSCSIGSGVRCKRLVGSPPPPPHCLPRWQLFRLSQRNRASVARRPALPSPRRTGQSCWTVVCSLSNVVGNIGRDV